MLPILEWIISQQVGYVLSLSLVEMDGGWIMYVRVAEQLFEVVLEERQSGIASITWAVDVLLFFCCSRLVGLQEGRCAVGKGPVCAWALMPCCIK